MLSNEPKRDTASTHPETGDEDTRPTGQQQGTVCSACVLERIKRTLHYSSQTTTTCATMLWSQYLKMVAILHIFISKPNGLATGTIISNSARHVAMSAAFGHTHGMQRQYMESDTYKRCFFWQKLIQMPIGHSWME